MNQKLMSIIVVVVAMAVTIVVSEVIGIGGILITFGALMGVMLTTRPKVVLIVFWIFALFADTTVLFTGGFVNKVIEQILGLYVLVLLLARMALAGTPLRGTKVFNWILAPLLALILVSGLANRVPALSFVFFILTYMKHFWIFYFAIQCLDGEDSPRIFLCMLLSFGIQLLFNLAFYVGLNPLPAMFGRRFIDSALGTLGSAHFVGYYMLACTLLLVAFLKRAQGLKTRVLLFAGVLTALVQFYLTFTMHAYPLLIAAIVFQYIVFNRRLIMAVMQVVALGAVFVCLLMLLVAIGPLSGHIGTNLSPESWGRRWHQVRSGYKGHAYEHVFLRSSLYLQHPLLGGGPGNYTSSTARLTNRPLSTLPHLAGPFYLYTSAVKDITAFGSVIYSPSSGFMSIRGDLGPFGFLLYWALHIYAGIRVYRFCRAARYKNRYQAALAEAFVSMCGVFLGMNAIFDGIPILHFSLGFWIWAGAVWHPTPPQNMLSDAQSAPVEPTPQRPRFQPYTSAKADVVPSAGGKTTPTRTPASSAAPGEQRRPPVRS